jgi:hypothetical protein
MIEEMSDEAFDKQIGALAVKRLEKPKKMSVQNAKFWSEITNQLYNFNRGITLLIIVFLIYRVLFGFVLTCYANLPIFYPSFSITNSISSVVKKSTAS